MTNFLNLLNMDNPYTHSAEDNKKDEWVENNYKNVIHQILGVLKNDKSPDVLLKDDEVKRQNCVINKRLENGSRLYYIWLRYLSISVAKTFLKDANARKAYSQLKTNNSEKENDRTVYEEKYVSDLVKEFQLLINNVEYQDMSEQDIIKPYLENFGQLLKEAGYKDEQIAVFKRYIENRIEAELDVNSHPELWRKTLTTESPKKKETKKEVLQDSAKDEQKKRIEPALIQKKTFTGKEIQIPSFMNPKRDAIHKITINDMEFNYREEDFPREVWSNKNRLAFELLYNALESYQQEINQSQLAVRSKKLFDRIAFSFKKFIASLSKTDYDMSLDGRKFTFDSNEVSKYRSKNDLMSDMANLAYGKYRNEISYPNHIYRTDEDFEELLKGQLVRIDSNGSDLQTILVFDHDLKEEDLVDSNSRHIGYTKVAYSIFQRRKHEKRMQKAREIKQKEERTNQIKNKKEVSDKVVSLEKYRAQRAGNDLDDFGEL